MQSLVSGVRGRVGRGLAWGALPLAALTCVAVYAPVGAQQAAPAAAPQRAPGLVAYPERAKAPQDVLDRGKAVYSVNCSFCHGSDAMGGAVGPNLMRSEVVLQDGEGELIMPIVHGSRAEKGMPRIDITDAQTKDISAWLHSLKTGGKMASTEKINIVVGDATVGKTSFDQTCGSCHSVTGDLAGFSSKFADPRAMQQAWMLPSGPGARAGNGPPSALPTNLHVPPTTASVTMANGAKVTGRLDAVDDFYIAFVTDDGVTHRFDREGDKPKVEINDPMAVHRALFSKYTDKQIHDITAYLVTVK